MSRKTVDPETLDRLRAWYPKGSTVYTILRSCSRSGMSRVIGMVSLTDTGDGLSIRHPNHATASVLGLTVKGDGVKIGGGGMDMGFHLAYEMASVLYGDGYALKHQWL